MVARTGVAMVLVVAVPLVERSLRAKGGGAPAIRPRCVRVWLLVRHYIRHPEHGSCECGSWYVTALCEMALEHCEPLACKPRATCNRRNVHSRLGDWSSMVGRGASAEQRPPRCERGHLLAKEAPQRGVLQGEG